MKRKKPHKKKSRVSLWIMLAIIGLIIVVAISFYTYKPSSRGEYGPNEYFTFTVTVAVIDSEKSTNDTIFIKELAFNITAVLGDAHHVSILPSSGNVEVEDAPYFLLLEKDKSQEGHVLFPKSVDSDRETEGFPIDFNIASDETVQDIVTLYITDDHIIKM